MQRNTFCILPWTHFYTQVDGAVRLCCLSHTPLLNREGGHLNIRQDSPIEIWNGADFRKIRQSMLNGESISHCSLCYEAESNGFVSRRQYMNEMMSADPNLPTEDKLSGRIVSISDPLVAKNPIYFDLRMGNLCNLRCRMCSPISSSQLEKDDVARKWSGNPEAELVGADVGDWPEAVDLLANLQNLCIDAVRIDLAGGEPTLNESQLGLLEYLIEKKVADNIDLMVTTNMTNKRERAFKTFSQFKSVSILLSIDGIDSVYNYIRYPARWEAVSRNVLALQQEYPSFYLIVFPCIQAYNVLYLVDLFDWCLEHQLRCDLNNVLFLPSYLGLSALPMDVRKVAAHKLRVWTQTRQIERHFVRAEIDRIIDYLGDEKATSTSDMDKFVQYTRDLDRSRGQDMRIVLPEIHSSLKHTSLW